jgi:transcription-repair coupling factor (superfamily II helicase)
VHRLEANAGGGRLVFNDAPNIDTMQLITLIQTDPHIYTFDGKNTLRFAAQMAETDARLAFIDALLTHLTNAEAA